MPQTRASLQDMDALKESVACVLKKSNESAGTAFVVSRTQSDGLPPEGLLLTCSHVLRLAEAPNTKFRVRFLNGKEYEIDDIRRDEKNDLAILSITKEPLPETARALPLGSSRGTDEHPIHSYGFPQATGLGGAHAKASILGSLDVRGVDSLQLTDSKELTSGFSGAPIWDAKRARVIGVARFVVEPDALGKLSETAFVISSECAKATFAELLVNDDCPFKALGRFTRNDERLYKGRTRAINSLLSKLSTVPSFLLVTGPSGSGKSSLVRAGLLPQIERDAFSGSSGWVPYIAEPDSTKTIREMVGASGIDLGAADLQAAVADWRKNHPAAKRLLIVIDQFERLFSEPFDLQRADFLKSLGRICSSPEWGITFVAVMRTEFYPSLLEQAPAQLASALDHSTLNVPKGITDKELQEIIEKRPTENGWAITPDLVTGMIDDAVGGGESAFLGEREAVATVLPLLEFALWRLWQPERPEDTPGQLTLPRYTAKGRLYGSLVDWADHAYQALPPEKRILARRVLTLLVRPGVKEKGVPATGQIQHLSYLGATGQDGAHVFEVIQHLTNYHLLVSDESTVQLAHDSLINRWPLLRFWVDEDYDFLKWRTSFDDLIEAPLPSPSTEKKPVKQPVIQGKELKESLGWLRSRRDDIPANIVATIERSRTVARLKAFALWSLAGVVLALGLVGALYLVQAKRNSEQALLRYSAFGSAVAVANANGNNLRATALTIAGPDSFVNDSRIDPFISQYATAANSDLPTVTDHFDQLYELSTGKGTVAAVGTRPGLGERQVELAVWEGPGAPRTITGSFTGLAISPDAQIVAIGDVEKDPLTIHLYSRKLELITTITAATLKAPRRFRFPDESPDEEFYPYSIGELRFSADGKRLFVAGLASHLKDVEIPHHWRAWADIPASLKRGQHLELTGQVDSGHELAYFSENREFLVPSQDARTLFSDGIGEIYEDDIASVRRSTIGNDPAGTDDIDISPSGKLVAGLGHRGVITVYQKDTDKWTPQTFTLPETAKPTLLRFVRETALIIALEDGRLIWLDIRPDQVLQHERLNLEGTDVIVPDRFRFINLGHKGRIRTLAVSPSRRYVATGSEDTTVGLVDTNSFEFRTLRGHDRAVTKLAFPSDDQLISGGLDGRICTWRWADRYLPGDPQKPDRNLVVTDSQWDEGGGLEMVIVRQHLGFVHGLKISNDGRFLLSRTYDGVVVARDISTGSVVRRVQSNENGYRDFAFTSDSQFVMYEGQARQASGMDESKFPPDGFELSQIRGAGEMHINTKVRPSDMLFSADGQWASRDQKDRVTLHTVAAGIDGSALARVKFSPTGKYFGAVGQNDVTIWLTSSPSNPFLHLKFDQPAADGNAPDSDSSDKSELVFSPLEDSVVLLQKPDAKGPILLWRLPDGKPVHISGPDLVNVVSYDPAGKLLAVGALYGNCYLFDTGTGALRVVLPKHARYITAVAFSPDGSFLATGSRDRTVRLWSNAGGLLTTFEFRNPVEDLAYDRSGRLFVATGNGIEMRRTPNGISASQVPSELEKMTNARYDPRTGSISFVPAAPGMK